MTKTPVNLQELRRRIYRKAKSEPSHRFWGLFVHIAKMETLEEAYRNAKRNGGTAGIDNQSFEDMEEGKISLNGMSIQTMWLNHPQGCMGFRLETKDGILVYATDNEPGDAVFDKNVRKLAEGADILIYDAQYLPEEYEARRRGWGHSHWREAVNVVLESGAKELVLFHHDPDHDDACIDKVVKEARNYYPRVRAAAEGLEMQLGNPKSKGASPR